MNNEHIRNLARISKIFFPPEQVRYIFEVGGSSAPRTVFGERYPGFHLGEIYHFSSAERDRLGGYIVENKMPGIDFLYIADANDRSAVLRGLGTKLRDVRLIYMPAGLHPGPLFRFFISIKCQTGRYSIFVNKDLAPRWLGIIRKRINLQFGTL